MAELLLLCNNLIKFNINKMYLMFIINKDK